MKSTPVVKRLEHLHEVTGKTWDELAEDLGVNRSMIFHVLGGRRQFSRKILHKLELLEIAAGIRTESESLIQHGLRGSELIKELLFGPDPGSVPATLKEIDRGTKRVPLEFRGTPPKGSRTEITVAAPDNATVLKVTGQQSALDDPSKFLMACLPPEIAKPEFLDKLTPQCYRRLWETALDLTFGLSWRKGP